MLVILLYSKKIVTRTYIKKNVIQIDRYEYKII